MTHADTMAFRVRLQAATLEKIIDIRQAHGLPAGDVIGLWTQCVALADRLERGQPAGQAARKPCYPPYTAMAQKIAG